MTEPSYLGIPNRIHLERAERLLKRGSLPKEVFGMDEQELNKKLAEWAGFKWRQFEHPIKVWGEEWEGAWFHLDIPELPIPKESLPNFTNSLDACFKWLVPKFYRYWMTRTNNCKEHRFEFSWGDADGFVFYYAEAETPALALCLAIEKLIEGGKQ